MDYSRNEVYVTCVDGVIKSHTKHEFTGSHDDVVLTCPEAAVCGLVLYDDGTIRFDENTYIVEKMKRILDASCSPTQMVSWLQVQVRAFAPLIRYTATDISGRDQKDPSTQI